MTFASGIAAILAYLASSADLLQRTRRGAEIGRSQSVLVLLLSLALLLHLSTLYPQVVSAQGFDFSFFLVASLIFLVMAFMGLLTLWSKQQVHSLLLVLFPLAALSVACSLLFSSNYTPRDELSPGVAAHILLSIVSTGLLTVAALQSLLLLLQMSLLKKRQTHGLIEALPSLQTMEWVLFRVLWAGFIGLSAALLLGGLYVEDLFGQSLAHKTAFSIGAWLVFATLLWGKHQLGWRGRTAVRWTLIGLALLAIGFFGSKLVLELILQRG